MLKIWEMIFQLITFESDEGWYLGGNTRGGIASLNISWYKGNNRCYICLYSIYDNITLKKTNFTITNQFAWTFSYNEE